MRIATTYLFILSIFVLIITSCEMKKEETAEVLPVSTETVQTGTLFRHLGFSGDIVGEAEIRVFSPIPERIVSLSAKEGDRVTAGDPLAVVRSKSLGEGVKQAAGGLDAVRAQRDSLRDQAQRMRRLADSGAVTASQLLTVEGQLASAEAQVRQLEAALGQAKQMKGDAIIRAPMNGVVGQVFVEVGDMAVPQVPICTLVEMDRVRIKVRVPESDLPSIAPGQPATFRVVAESAAARRATISRISPVLDRLSRTATMEIDVDNADHALRPGMLARVEVEVERRDNAVWARKDALTVTAERRGEAQIFRAVVVKADKAVERRVLLGMEDGVKAHILEGLEPGDQLIVRGQHLLADGDPVKVVPAATERDEGATGKAAKEPAPIAVEPANPSTGS